MRTLLIAAFGLFCLTLRAEVGDPRAALTTQAPSAAVLPWRARLELRPAWRTGSGAFLSENSAYLGVALSEQVQVGYKQYFNNNFYSPGVTTSGLGLVLDDGFVETRVRDIWKDGGTSLSFENRAYTPTADYRRRAGMLTALRNYFIFKQRVVSGVSVMAFVCPTLHVYERAGNTVAGRGSANPLVEQRNYLALDIAFSPKLSLFFPLKFSHTRLATFDGAAGSGSWTHRVYVEPLLTYQLTPQLYFGAGFRSENLVLSDFSSTTVSDGLKNGLTHLMVGASL